MDLSVLEYGPSHQLDLALTPAEDPFLAKKVRFGGTAAKKTLVKPHTAV